MLVMIANAANHGGHGLPITIFADGSVISGWTVSGKEFLDQLTEQLGQGDPNRTEKLRQGAFAGTYDLYEPDKNNDIPTSIIHLKDVAIITPNTRTHVGENVVCRFRIDSITGFYFGAARGVSEEEIQED